MSLSSALADTLTKARKPSVVVVVVVVVVATAAAAAVVVAVAVIVAVIVVCVGASSWRFELEICPSRLPCGHPYR